MSDLVGRVKRLLEATPWNDPDSWSKEELARDIVREVRAVLRERHDREDDLEPAGYRGVLDVLDQALEIEAAPRVESLGAGADGLVFSRHICPGCGHYVTDEHACRSGRT